MLSKSVSRELRVGFGYDRFSKEVVPLLDSAVASILTRLDHEQYKTIEEVRLRAFRPLLLRFNKSELALTKEGKPTTDLSSCFQVTPDMVRNSLDMMASSSLYAKEEEVRNGFITLPGGHRVGIGGKVVLEAGRIKTIKQVSSLNVRVARELHGIAKQVLPYIKDETGVFSSLIISPPQAGKTTLLRDIARILSVGNPETGIKGHNVGVVDERSELAGCWDGIVQNNLGPRTDVLDGCPKALGMIILLRAMSPEVIVTDELGKMEDVSAVEEVVNGGVRVITTLHGQDESEIERRPFVKALLMTGVFRRVLVLSRRLGVGTVEKIIDWQSGRNILTCGPLRLKP